MSQLADSILQIPYFMTTNRVGFRHWIKEDLPLARELWTDADVMRFMSGSMAEDQAHARFALEMERQERLGFCYWPIKFHIVVQPFFHV